MCDPGYEFDTGAFTSSTGHFTQVVWKTSTELGIGRASSKKDGMFCTFVVARYKEAGNLKGAFKENVLKGNFSKDVCGKLDEMISKIGEGNESSFQPGLV